MWSKVGKTCCLEQILGAVELLYYWTLYFSQWAVSQWQTAYLVGSPYARSKTQDTNPRQQHSENTAIREEMKREKHIGQKVKCHILTTPIHEE